MELRVAGHKTKAAAETFHVVDAGSTIATIDVMANGSANLWRDGECLACASKEAAVAAIQPAYTITDARYAKGKKAVRCPSSTGYKTRAAYLAERLASGRYTNREHAYIMSAAAAVRFEKLYAEGWDVSFSGVLTPPKMEEGAVA